MRTKKSTNLFNVFKAFTGVGILFSLLTMYTLAKNAIEMGCTLKGALVYTLQSIFFRHQDSIEFSWMLGGSNFDVIVIMYAIAFIVVTSFLADIIFKFLVTDRILRIKTPSADALSMIWVMLFAFVAMMQWIAVFIADYNGMSAAEVFELFLPAFICSFVVLGILAQVYSAPYKERLISKKRFYLLFLIQFFILGLYITYIYLFELPDILEMQGNPMSSLGKVPCVELKIIVPW
ncbi:hypothetical protein L2750_09360 [Shewanella submarina]|uniref:Uncharacterized protein n=1 Tax=Shewanella submarina TaxID=2016376 RepID=A0ABV7G6W5_9GAMM|nr:hypothetical protein [Shewanella submarina]MCL1037362.1 hypothetical protein [Shewanella submarina]